MKPHIHNHIVFNSTDFTCKKKFRNFLFSGIALQRLSDIICLENGLSVITPRKPSERMKRIFIKKDTFRDGVRLAIDKTISERPADFEEFLRLLQKQDYEIKRGKHFMERKQVISLEHKQQTFNLAELLTDRVELILGCRSETRM